MPASFVPSTKSPAATPEGFRPEAQQSLLLLQQDYEEGTNGTAISAGNSVGTYEDAISGVTLGAGNTLTYDATPLTFGSLSALHAVGGTTQNCFWNWKFGKLEEFQRYYLRGYFQMDVPTVNQELFAGLLSSFTWKIHTNTSGQVVLTAGTTSHATSASVLTANQPFRLENFVDHPNGSMVCRLFLGANVEGTVADEEFRFDGFAYPAANINEVRVGPEQLTAINMRTDAVALSTASWIGPLNPSTGTTLTATQSAVARVQATPTFTQPAIARVQAIGLTKTQDAIARVQKTLTFTQSALARVQATLTKTQPATARVQSVVTKAQSATGRVQAALTKTQSSVARIQATRTKTQAAVSRVQATPTRTQTAAGRIQITTTKTQPSVARLRNTVTFTQSATATVAGGVVPPPATDINVQRPYGSLWAHPY